MKKDLRVLSLLLAFFGLLVLSSCDDGDETKKVAGELKAKIDVSKVNFITDLRSIDGRRIKTGQAVTFSDGSEGSPVCIPA